MSDESIPYADPTTPRKVVPDAPPVARSPSPWRSPLVLSVVGLALVIVLCTAAVIGYQVKRDADAREVARLEEAHREAQNELEHWRSIGIPSATYNLIHGDHKQADRDLDTVLARYKAEREAYASLRKAQGLPAPTVDAAMIQAYRQQLLDEAKAK